MARACRRRPRRRERFEGVAGQHLLLGFASASFADGFDTLELSITNNGVGLFSRLFTSADDAMLFLNDNVLDFGLFGAGAQDVRVSSTYSYFKPGAFAFNYVVGTGAVELADAGARPGHPGTGGAPPDTPARVSR